MTYQEKVQKSKEVLKAIKALKKDESLKFTYGTLYNSNSPRVLELRAYDILRDELSYTVAEPGNIFGRGMNVGKITSTSIKLYSYDLMNQRTSFSLPMYEMGLQVSTPE